MGADCISEEIFEIEDGKEGHLVISVGHSDYGANLNVEGYGLIDPSKKQIRKLIQALNEALHYFDKRTYKR